MTNVHDRIKNLCLFITRSRASYSGISTSCDMIQFKSTQNMSKMWVCIESFLKTCQSHSFWTEYCWLEFYLVFDSKFDFRCQQLRLYKGHVEQMFDTRSQVHTSWRRLTLFGFLLTNSILHTCIWYDTFP